MPSTPGCAPEARWPLPLFLPSPSLAWPKALQWGLLGAAFLAAWSPPGAWAAPTEAQQPSPAATPRPAPTVAPALRAAVAEGLTPHAVVPLTQRYEERLSFEGPEVPVIKVVNLRGQVQVLAWDRPELWIQALKRPSAPLGRLEAKAYPQIRPQAAKVGPHEAALAIAFPPELGPFPHVAAAHLLHTWVDLKLVVPRRCVLELEQSDGDVAVAGTQGRLSLSSTEGSLSVGPHQGQVELRTARGGLQAHDVDGDVVAQAEVGPSRFWALRGDLRARSTEGPIQVEVAPDWLGEVRVHTVTGAFRSDLASAFSRGGEPPLGFVGWLVGPRAPMPSPQQLPTWRLEIDTTGGDAVVASTAPWGAGNTGGRP